MQALVDERESKALIEVAFPLPRAPHTSIHLQYRDNGPNILLLLTTTPSATTTVPFGSMVYAMPIKGSPSKTLSTVLFSHNGTIDFTTRLAKVLAVKASKPIYVGNSSNFESTGLGGTVEEEMEGFRRIVDAVLRLALPLQRK